MSSPVFISLYVNGRQRDYHAFVSCINESSCVFQVVIDEQKVTFEGGFNHAFKISRRQENLSAIAGIDSSLLEAMEHQLNKMFA